MKEAEDIIISKRFFELTPSELEAVKEFATNEDDYEAMRWFLQSTKDTFAEEKIIPSTDLRKNVMAHLAQQKPSQTIWLNGVSAFLFPSQKKFYQYPAFQLAAAAVVLIGFVFIYDSNMQADKELAVNDNNQIITDNKTIVSNDESPIATEALGEQTPPVETDLRTGENLPGQNGPVVTGALVTQPDINDGVVTRTVVSDNNYALMSVAEESRMVSNEKLILEEQNQYGYTNANTFTNYRADEDKSKVAKIDNVSVAPADDRVGNNELKKETGKNEKSSNAELYDDKDLSGTVSPSVNGGTPVTTTGSGGTTTVTTVSTDTEKFDDEGGKYKTATAGGVFGDTASEPESSTKLEADIPAKNLSVGQSSELKALFFVVK